MFLKMADLPATSLFFLWSYLSAADGSMLR